MSLSAYCKAHGHQSHLLIVSLEKDLYQAIQKEKADLVAFSITTGRHLWAVAEASRIKERTGLPVLVGGPHATYFPEIVKEEVIDYACIGEGEGALVDVLDALSEGKDPRDIPNIAVCRGSEIHINPVRDLIPDLDSLPFADRAIYHRYPLAHAYQQDTCIMLTGRGCPYNCSFCYNRACKRIYQGKGVYLRKRSVDHVITEMRLLKDQWSIQRFIIDDDTFTYQEDWVDEFADQYVRLVALPFICNARAENLSERVVSALRRAGCAGVKMGVETADETLRRTVLNKPITNDDIYAASQRLAAHRIPLQTFNILGLPGGDLSKDLETVRLNQRLRTSHAWCSLLNPYPGTAIREIAMEKGMLAQDPTGEFSRESYFVDTPLELEDKREVVHLHHLFDMAVRFPRSLPWIERILPLPMTPIFELLFKLDHAISIKRFYRIRVWTWIRFLWACRGIY